MIIWSGLGFLVPIVAFGCFVLTELVVESALGDDTYYQEHTWPMALAFGIAALGVAVLGKELKDEESRILVDEKTGERVAVNGTRHSFFFVPTRYWAPILLVIGLLVLLWP
jgi:hypothetical protein